MSDTYTLDNNPWHQYVPLAASLGRTLMIAAGGAGFTWAKNVTGDQVELWISAAFLAGGASWSFYQKIQAIRALHRASRNPAGAPPPSLPA